MSSHFARAILVSLITAVAAHAGTILCSIGPDGSAGGPVPRRVIFWPLSDRVTTTWLGDVGFDNTRGITGGLTYRSSDGELYAVANDSNGVGSLLTFSPSDPYNTTDVMALTSGILWTGGLVAGGSGLYAVGTDGEAFVPSLYFNGGLAYDGTHFYALANDSSFSSAYLRRYNSSGTLLNTLPLDPAYPGGLVYAAPDSLLALRTGVEAWGITA